MLNIPDAENAKEAAGLIIGGLFYFVMKKPLITLPVLALLMWYPAFAAYDYFTSEKIQVKKAKPAKVVAEEDEGMLSLFSSTAYAGNPTKPCKDSIVINGVFYGCEDTTLQAYALLGGESWIIHDHQTGEINELDLPFVLKARELFYKQQKKGK
jgi:hypothetical protein